MEIIKGYVDHIIYRNQSNAYTVFVLQNEEGELSCTGYFSFIEEGELLELKGDYVSHPTYGLQLQVTGYKECEPEDLVSIERYLGGGAIKGIGQALAGKIVGRFREDTFRVIEEEPELLAQIRGISERKAMEIARQVEEKKEVRNAVIFMQKYGISTSLGMKIYQFYQNNIYRILEENPYQLADEIEGVGFKTADEIATKVGILRDSDFRIKSGLYYTLQQSASEGHTYLVQEDLLNRTKELLGVPVSQVENHLIDLSMERKIIIKNEDSQVRIYPATYYYMELNVARMLDDLNYKFKVFSSALESRMEEIESEESIILDGVQKEAVFEAAQNGVMVLTGGPGTGKTTTINAMIRFFQKEGMSILLGAPTGRAAKRMSEATGYEATTIHRMLGVNKGPEEEESGFSKNEDYPLETDVVIIDEVSMVDLPLMSGLLKAIIPGTRLILVGDINQLPSVGVGKVLEDVISSGVFPVVKLTEIFRQAKESDIVVNAHKINKGEAVVADNKSEDFFFLKRQEASTIINVVLLLIKEKLPNYVHATSYDIQVLTPTRKGLLGVDNLNIELQKHLNPASRKKKEKLFGERLFREGDKVMQIKNNYQLEWQVKTKYGMAVDSGLGVYNGDIGIIKAINDYEESVEIIYDENKSVSYPYALLEEVELAYAITVHKSQGSEYPGVVIPLLSGPRPLYNRNLIYTAITRAKSCVTIVGSETVFQDMIKNTMEQKRNTTLSKRIQELHEGANK
ncbi:exodeoxyribonuclease V alpha subunit [Aequitasia blattaphilus]|uniref:ATP-dependent RecD2 DNA helicase n=1 Tax=Aequitasia blattaphilus TaxID=2949332 RepID=A0ABT1E6C2_9FIRM|nr:ATP-dependent RecD-like DNA helicase [Aequitasia blattaphilus]MCP1101383.1 ATP-dependent RecD-like DNA helicase [Aequitasia blattaphilus]MCR8614023.1 ATP-dependent RecD-like DNA helicase [Aequitasia blattaphilus]